MGCEGNDFQSERCNLKKKCILYQFFFQNKHPIRKRRDILECNKQISIMRKRYTELTNVLVHIAGSEALESISFLITSWMKCTRKGKGLREMIRNSLNNAPESSDII